MVVMKGEREGLFPGQFGGEPISMGTRISPHGTQSLFNTHFPTNGKLKESVHLIIRFPNEERINAVVDHLEEPVARARLAYEPNGTVCGVIIITP